MNGIFFTFIQHIFLLNTIFLRFFTGWQTYTLKLSFYSSEFVSISFWQTWAQYNGLPVERLTDWKYIRREKPLCNICRYRRYEYQIQHQFSKYFSNRGCGFESELWEKTGSGYDRQEIKTRTRPQLKKKILPSY